MAAILRLPGDGSPGIVSFTTQERDNAINNSPETRAAVGSLKSRWLVGLHHNWHDYAFRYDPLFDFSFAGDEDLREVNGTSFPVLGLDACNFTPEVFAPGGEPFWDVLFVARAVYFKRIPEFLTVVRNLYDSGNQLRVLLISPMPPFDPGDAKTALYDLRQRYEASFTDEEQDRFTLLTIDWRYPFPFDLPTLAHFYRSSRVFVHTADDERRCRVAAYAWASGLPVVGSAPVGSLLSTKLRRPPWFYEVKRDRDFPRTILEALDASPLATEAVDAVRREVSASCTRVTLLKRLAVVADGRGQALDETGFALERLDIRLGRHHGLGSQGPNRLEPSVAEFVELLGKGGKELFAGMAEDDPEKEIERLASRRRRLFGIVR